MAEARAAGPSWGETPRREPSRSRWWIVGAIVLGALPVLVQLRGQGYLIENLRLPALLAATYVVVAHRWPRWWAFVALGTAIGYLVIGRSTSAAWLSMHAIPVEAVMLLWGTTVLWSMLVEVVDPPGGRLTRSATHLALPGLIVADVLLVAVPGFRVPFVAWCLAVGGLLVGVAAPAAADEISRRGREAIRPVRRFVGGVKRVVDRVAAAFGRVLAAVLMVPGVLLVGLPWLSQRLVRYDVLAPPVLGGSRWVDRRRVERQPTRLASGRDRPDPRGIRRSLHRGAATLVALLLLGTVPVTVSLFEAQETPCGYDAQLEGRPGWPGVGCEIDQFARHGHYDAVTAYSFDDFEGDYVNVRDGRRTTWAPPPCQCRRVRVWWFGGSAAWGWLQRDQHTVASQFAKAAWADGIALDIENFAMPGWVLGQESQKFADMTSRRRPPDIVVFYDGGNELNGQKDRAKDGRGADESPFSFAEQEMSKLLREGPFRFGSEEVPRKKVARSFTTPTEIAEHAMNRYRRDVDAVTRVAKEVGVDPVLVWQPLLPAAPRATWFPRAMSPDDLTAWKEMLPVARAALPATVVDLSDSMDEVDEPVFRDVFHTTEEGADVAARDLERRLRSRLEAVAARGPGGGS